MSVKPPKAEVVRRRHWPSFDFAFEAGSSYAPGVPVIYFGNWLATALSGAINTGSLSLSLIAGTTFAPIGTAGNVYWGFGSTTRVLSGSWEIVAPVPLPAALPLYGTGLAVMGFIGWRRKGKAAA